MTRRALLLGAGAGVTAIVAGCWVHLRNQPEEQAEEVLGVPDLGAELFPDGAGRAVVSLADAPVIVLPRSAWTKEQPNFRQMALMNGCQHITIHHTAGARDGAVDGWLATTEDISGIRDFHAGTKPTDRKWADIAYHWVIDPVGRVWQARPMVYQGAHAKGHNAHNIGIVVLGNFDKARPSAAQLVSLNAFSTFLRRVYRIPVREVYTHGELGHTSCPGKMLQEWVNRTRPTWA